MSQLNWDVVIAGGGLGVPIGHNSGLRVDACGEIIGRGCQSHRDENSRVGSRISTSNDRLRMQSRSLKV